MVAGILFAERQNAIRMEGISSVLRMQSRGCSGLLRFILRTRTDRCLPSSVVGTLAS